MESIDNIACPPWHPNQINIKIDTSSKAQAAYTHSTTNISQSNNKKIILFYSASLLLNGAMGAWVIGLRSGKAIIQKYCHLGGENEGFTTELDGITRATELAHNERQRNPTLITDLWIYCDKQ